MSCSQVRRVLYPTPDKALVTIQTAEAMEHLKHCLECRDYFAASEKWSEALREKVGAEPAPDPLRERVAWMIEERCRRPRFAHVAPPRLLAMLAAAIALMALAASWLASRIPSQEFFQELCLDHAKYLDARSQVSSSDPTILESWLRDRAEFGVRVPILQSTDLLGGRLCFLKGHKAALIFYRRQGRPVSMFQMNSAGVSLSVLDRTVIDGSPVWHKSFSGYSLVAFENRGVITVLVSGLRESELLPLALEARRG